MTNYIGQEVRHKEFGTGRITKQDFDSIMVAFSNGVEREFVYPDCFGKYLWLTNKSIASLAAKESQKKAEEVKEREEKYRLSQLKEQAARKREALETAKPEKRVIVNSVSEFVDKEKELLKKEINYLRDNGEKRTKLHDGELVEIRNHRYIYSFESDSELFIPDNTQIKIWLPRTVESFEARVMNCDGFTVIISTGMKLNSTTVEFEAETWRLLKALIDRLDELRDHPSEIVKSITTEGRKKIQEYQKLTHGQEAACRMSLSQPITFIWGPPGTGKTETLAKIALQHIEKGYRVLMLSYSNVSVDGAVWRVNKYDTKGTPGKLVRYGYPRDKELLHHEYLTPYNLSRAIHRDLVSKRKSLIEEGKKVSRSSSRYLQIHEKIREIDATFKDEEKNAVDKALFVATTVSKATVDKMIFEAKFDTVIFDEASMAYIPQIVFSAGLAKRHFICMGDFSQLPPIVQSKDNGLDQDIFDYCGIITAVDKKFGHDWLCMLDTQYRMHPDISNFVSKNMYYDLLKTGNAMAEERKEIVNAAPFSGFPMYLVDLSGMMSVCQKTKDGSYFNVLSAIMTMGLAIRAAEKHEVGIITPYSAQSRLLYAMSRDVGETKPELKTITCATVHQFQGSEKDVIFFDAVDCYRRRHPGKMLALLENNYANRLFNVALTRAKGKMVSVANVDFLKEKNLSKLFMVQNLL